MTAPSPTRKDAARNRAILLESATRLFRDEGLKVTLKDVAGEAGVGVGTVYRHFPTKDNLVEGLFTTQLEAEVNRARQASEASDAWQALVDYLEETMRLQADNRGLRALMCPAGSVFDAVRQCKAAVNPYIEQVVALAHDQGTLRGDCTAGDIAYLQVALVGIMDAAPDEPEIYQRHLAHFLDGVRAEAPE